MSIFRSKIVHTLSSSLSMPILYYIQNEAWAWIRTLFVQRCPWLDISLRI